MPRKSDPKPAAAAAAKKPTTKPTTKPKPATLASKARTPRTVEYMAEVFHGWMEHTELLGVIPITAKSRDDVYAQADALYHHNWKPFVTPGRKFDREQLEIRIRPLAEWAKRATTLLAKATVKLEAARATEAAKAAKPKRRKPKPKPKPTAPVAKAS
jgi:hypothetical protein